MSASKPAFRTRIGKVRFKNGCEVRRLPSFRDRCTRASRGWLKHDTDKIDATFADDMAGYVIVAWDSDGEYSVRMRSYGKNPSLNTLPQWVSGAIGREIASFDMRRRLNMDEPE